MVIFVLPDFNTNLSWFTTNDLTLGCQTSDSASSSKFHHLALLVALVSRSPNFHHWPLLALLMAMALELH